MSLDLYKRETAERLASLKPVMVPEFEMNLVYIWIFVGCYIAVSVFLIFHWINKNSLAAARLRWNGVSGKQIRNFYKLVTISSVLPLIWQTFFFGSICGVAISILYSLVSV